MPKVKPIVLDGSTLEGGGQLVRVALSLSAITSTTITITNIRANRAPNRSSKPQSHSSRLNPSSNSRHSPSKVEGGLKESHLAAVLYLAKHCNAYIEGALIGSRELTFNPHASTSRSQTPHLSSKSSDGDDPSKIEHDTITLTRPGSIWLILQALLPYLIFQPHPTTLTLFGGTNVPSSMSYDYISMILVPTLARLGINLSISLHSRGWAGNAPSIGSATIKISPISSIPDFTLSQPGKLSKFVVKIVAGDEDTKRFFVDGLAKCLGASGVGVEFLDVEDSGDERRIYILLVAETDKGQRFGRDYLGTGKRFGRGEKEKVFGSVCEMLVRDIMREIGRGGCVDEFLQDQLVIFQALAGRSVVEGGKNERREKIDDQRIEGQENMNGDQDGSLHTRTVRWVCESISKVKFGSGGICEGIAWKQRTEKDER